MDQTRTRRTACALTDDVVPRKANLIIGTLRSHSMRSALQPRGRNSKGIGGNGTVD